MADPALGELPDATGYDDAPAPRRPEVLRALQPRPRNWSYAAHDLRLELEGSIIEFARTEHRLIERGRRIKTWEKMLLLTALRDIFSHSQRESRRAQERYLVLRGQVLARIRADDDAKLHALAAKSDPKPDSCRHPIDQLM